MTSRKACIKCRLITKESVCPNCKGTKFTTSWKGRIAILNIDSEIAKKLNLTTTGEYAIKTS